MKLYKVAYFESIAIVRRFTLIFHKTFREFIVISAYLDMKVIFLYH